MFGCALFVLFVLVSVCIKIENRFARGGILSTTLTLKKKGRLINFCALAPTAGTSTSTTGAKKNIRKRRMVFGSGSSVVDKYHIGPALDSRAAAPKEAVVSNSKEPPAPEHDPSVKSPGADPYRPNSAPQAQGISGGRKPQNQKAERTNL